MVWNQRGKKGVHSGRTLRRNMNYYSRCRTIGINKNGLVVKYQRNAERFPHSLKESLLEDRYGLADGLTLGHTPQPFHFNAVIEFSLGKRKRWLLPDLVRERVSIEDSDFEDILEEDENEEELNVCFVERHMHCERPRSKGDCLSVFSDKDGKTQTPKKHKYSYQTDIRKLDKDHRPPEICYEICRPPPATSWPNLKEDQFSYENFDKLGQGKGHKSKGCHWGLYGVKDLSINNSKEIFRDEPNVRHRRNTESKIKTVTSKQFSDVKRKMDSEKSPSRFEFSLAQCVDGVLKGSNGTRDENKVPTSTYIPVSPVKKYGKGCAVCIDTEPSTKPANNNLKKFGYLHIEPTISLEEFKPQIKVNIVLQDMEVSTLRSEWGDAYSEGRVCPRKFTLNITNLLPRNDHGSCTILFEVNDRMDNEKTSTEATLSLLPMTHGYEGYEFAKASQNFVSVIEKANRSAPLRIKEIVTAAVKVFATEKADKPMQQTENCKMTVRTLRLLNEMCGWGSESFTLNGAKQLLKDEYQKEVTGCKGECTALDSQWKMLSVECGICFETFEDHDTILTSLQECGHAFCSDCWKGHLKTQINQGIHCIKCPGQSCDNAVDDAIIMSVLPQWYEKFLNMKLNKQLETSPNWKWCPGIGCHKVVKATAPDLDAMTVLCDCGIAWCFKCQKSSHWPATCKESEVFEKKGGDFREFLMQENKELITSVMVKNCPQCNYPIEKYHGCQFMMCVLCGTHFCWNCCTAATYGHSCNQEPTSNLTKIDLSYKRKKYQYERFLTIVVKSIQSRVPKQLSAKNAKAKALETGVSSYRYILSKIPKESFANSNVSRLMEDIVERGILEIVQGAAEFGFQAHLVLEGFAKKAGVSRAQCKGGLHKMSQLAFVVERTEYLSQEPLSLSKDGRIQKLENLLAIGRDCILALKKCCTVKKN